MSRGERMKGGMKAVTPRERDPDRGRCREDSVSLSSRRAEPTSRTHTPPSHSHVTAGRQWGASVGLGERRGSHGSTGAGDGEKPSTEGVWILRAE